MRTAVKVGARNNASDKTTIQAIHDSACDLGADCKPMDNIPPAGMNEGITAMINGKSVKGMMDLGALEYARQEGWDIVSASQVLSQIAQMCQSEMTELVHLDTLSTIMKDLCAYIVAEVDEMGKAAEVAEAVAPEPIIDAGTTINATYEGEVLFKSAGTNNTAAGKTTETIPAQVKSADMNLSYVKSLGVTVPDMAVKFTAKDEIKGYTFLWGNEKLTDLEIEYFTKSTDFWDVAMGKSPRPLTWDHAQDPTFKASPVIGQIIDFGDDEIGRWYVAKLDRSHQYNKAIAALIKEGKLGTSSDSAPQYVERVKTGKATWLKTWAWFASALTDSPAEPRMIGSLEILKSLGVQLPDTAKWKNYTMTSDYIKTKYQIGD